MTILTNTTRISTFAALMSTLIAAPLSVFGGPGVIADTPLFLTNSVKHNVMLAIDDSGSMDSEVLMPANDGALWWNTNSKSFVGNEQAGNVNYYADGTANGTWKKYVYLFPNGTATGNRIYSDSSHDHFAIPPLPQYAHLRSSDYNAAYYDPTVTYKPWVSYGTTTFSDITAATAPSDPVRGTSTFNLTANVESTSANSTFKMHDGMVITKGTYYNSTGAWVTAAADVPVTATTNVGIRYNPATYYRKVTTGSYSLNSGATTLQCSATPDPANYITFHTSPGDFVSSDVHALGPDGACLEATEIAAGDSEMQNFANWFSYYRKRHMAMRQGVGHSFENISHLRTGLFRINNRVNVTMLDIDADRNTFYSTLYGFVSNGGTPNRQALDHAGLQYMRTGTGAPITEVCQKCFTILFTDGFATTDTSSGAGNADGDKGAPYADTYSNTMADIAMKYYTTNLRGDLTLGKVQVSSKCSEANPDALLDCNKNLHMNTYGVTLGTEGTIFGVTHNTRVDAHTTPPTWPSADNRDATMVDDLYHATVNGRGQMYNAKKPTDIATQMQAVLKSITDSSGSAAAVTFNSSSLGTNSAVYLGSFNSISWSGDLTAYALDPVSGAISNSPTWHAASKLDARVLADNPRVILTSDGIDGLPFQWDSLEPHHQADLKTGTTGLAESDAAGKARLAFIRGDRNCERSQPTSVDCDPNDDNSFTSKVFRDRASRMGDVVHSGPVYVGIPESNWPDSLPAATTPYSSYRTSKAYRTGVVYIGSNDGMLHAFSASQGTELMSYIPNAVYSSNSGEGLHVLTDPSYSHRYYNDMTPTVVDAFIKTTDTDTAGWKTVLVSGMRAGARALYALDVTTPSFSEDATAAADTVMWEFTHPDLGYTFSRPSIVPVKVAANTYKWAAIFGNGYNDQGDGKAKLFVVYLEGGLDGTWTLTTDYSIITTNSGGTSDRNGLASPAVIDTNGDGIADRAYAGDLKGQMWAFNLETMAIAHKFGKPLFTAKTGQPITTLPVIVRNPAISTASNNAPNVLVLFGTGQYLTSNDVGNVTTQSFYGVWDRGTNYGDLTTSDLVEQTLSVSGNARLVDTDPPVEPDYAGSDYGWYMDLNLPGERQVTDPIIRGDLVYFNTTIPNTGACSFGGTGWQMAINYTTGAAPEEPAFDINNNSVVNGLDLVDGYVPGGKEFTKGLPTSPSILGNRRYTAGTDGTEGTPLESDVIETIDSADTGRLSWEQLSP